MKPAEPKVLFLDIETSLITANMFSIGYNIAVHASQIIKGSHTDIICIGYKWAGESKIHCPDWGVKKQNSKKMLIEVIQEIETADVVLGHNGDSFDVKLINTLALMHRLPPIAWPVTEDTVKMARKHFKFNSNKLDHIARVLIGDKKLRTDQSLWTDIQFKKCPKALRKMIKYCKKDVKLLEDVYNIIRPYCEPKVNRSLLKNLNREGCPSCGSKQVHRHGTRVTTKGGIYRRLRCAACGHSFKHYRQDKQPKGVKNANK